MLKPNPIKGRGFASNVTSHYVEFTREAFDDGWKQEQEWGETKILTQVFTDSSRKIVTYNESPEVPFDRSNDPYKGCEYGCVYCFARPTPGGHSCRGFIRTGNPGAER